MAMRKIATPEEAQEIRAAAEKGDTAAQVRLGDLYRLGEGVEQNPEEAQKWYRRASEQGNGDGMYGLARCYEEERGEVRRSRKTIEELLIKSADHGSSRGMARLGDLYLRGKGLNGTRADALKWFRKAAEAGSVHAMMQLGMMYGNALETELDYAESAKWYGKASEQGESVGMCRLASCYEEGKGVPQDYAKAAELYRKSADDGVMDAACALGSLYERGLGVPQDYAEAMRWYRKAADRSATAVCRIGDMYLKGLGMPADPHVAAQMYAKAAEEGSWEAEIKAADLMSDEKSPAYDRKKALELYKAAADHANIYAEYRIGCLLQNDEDFAARIEALKWLTMAANNGYKEARDIMLITGFAG